MFHFYILLLILIQISFEDIEYINFPLNTEFNIQINESNKNIYKIYIGNIMAYLKIKIEDKKPIYILNNVNNLIFDFKNISIKSGDEEIRSCGKCNKTELGYDCEKTCIEEASVGYGAYVFIRLFYFPIIFILAGTFMIFFGRNHYSFSILFEFAGALYFFIVDCTELTNSFEDNAIPFYIICASLLSGFLILILGNVSINANAKQSILFEIFKIIKACIIGYFFIKTIFYYISIFAPINRILFMIFLFLFIIIGGVGEYFLKNKFKTDQILFITSSILAGSMFITKGIGYILGGYFSDGMTSHFELKYGSDAKLRVTFFLVFHIILIAGGFLYQIMDYKANIFEESISRQNSSRSGNYEILPYKKQYNKDINSNNGEDDKEIKDMNLKESLPGSKSDDVNFNENDENAELNDQDD